jgi:hypothetical protein
MLRYAPRFHDFFLIGKKKLSKFFREFIFRENFFQFFLAIVVPQPIWGMPANIWGV